MMVDSQFKSLQDIVGHEPSDCFSWEDKGNKQLSEKKVEHYKQWLNRVLSSEEKQSLCFLDITLASIDNTEFYGLLLTPNELISESYRQAIKGLRNFNGKCRSVGSHNVFQSGLPVFRENDNDSAPEQMPQTKKELENCRVKKLKVIRDRYLYWNSPSQNDSQNKKLTDIYSISMENFYTLVVNESEFGSSSNLVRDENEQASSFPIEENWQIFCENLNQKRDELTNVNGEPLASILGIPICFWFYEEEQKNIPIGQIFIGLAGAKEDKLIIDISQKIVTHILRSVGASRAHYIGAYRARGNISHRLPGTLESMILDLCKQKEKIPSLRIPSQFYILYMIASLQREQIPRWKSYEDPCEQGNQFVLQPEVLERFWSEVILPVGTARVRLDPDPIFINNSYQVDPPDFKIQGKQMTFKSRNECSTLLSLCCPLLIEACQHGWMWSICEFIKTGRSTQAVINLSLEEQKIVISNPSPSRSEQSSLSSPKRTLSRGIQKSEVSEILRLSERIFDVEFPNDPSKIEYGKMWQVTIKKIANEV